MTKYEEAKWFCEKEELDAMAEAEQFLKEE